MEAKSIVITQALINRFHRDSIKDFLKTYTPDESKEILTTVIKGDDIRSLLLMPPEDFNSIHFSWFIPMLKNLNTQLRCLTIAAFPENVAGRLRQFFEDKVAYPPIKNPNFQSYFLSPLYRQLLPENGILPRSFLPESPLSFLLEASKDQLTDLFDYLGLYDLADKIREVVDKKYLQSIYKCLSPKQQQFIRMCLHQKEKVVAPKLVLTQWSGDCKELNLLLHRRGMARFGKALCGQHQDFFWYISHVLDTGRSSSLEKYYHQETPKATPVLVQQVTTTFNFLNKSQP